MARTTDEIQAAMDAEQSAQPDLAALNSQSQVAIYRLFKRIIAQTQNLFEQIMDKKIEDAEKTIRGMAVPSRAWMRQKAFEFQYDSVTPQEMVLVDFVPKYSVVDESKRIITRAFGYNQPGVFSLYVAKNEPPEKLSAPELASIRGYYTDGGSSTVKGVGIGFAGQGVSVYSTDPDLIFIEADIEYHGAYAGTIQSDTINAINNFITNVGDTPLLKVTDLIDVLQNVPGFSDIFIHNMSARDSVTAWGSGTDIILADTQLLTEYFITSGYAIGETTVGQTFTDQLTFNSI